MVDQQAKRDAFYMRTENPIIKNFLSKQENKSEAMEKIIEDVLTGQLIPKSEMPIGSTRKEELELEYKYLRNKKISIDIQLKERELTYWNSFQQPPTLQASTAMRTGLQTVQQNRNTSYPRERLEKAFEYMTNKLSSGKLGCNECTQIFDSNEKLHSHFEYVHQSQLAAVIRSMGN